jgi:hypothetical protein
LLAIKQGHSCQANEKREIAWIGLYTGDGLFGHAVHRSSQWHVLPSFFEYTSLMAPSLFLFIAFRHLFCSFMLCFVSPCFQLLCATLWCFRFLLNIFPSWSPAWGSWLIPS